MNFRRSDMKKVDKQTLGKSCTIPNPRSLLIPIPPITQGSASSVGYSFTSRRPSGLTQLERYFHTDGNKHFKSFFNNIWFIYVDILEQYIMHCYDSFGRRCLDSHYAEYQLYLCPWWAVKIGFDSWVFTYPMWLKLTLIEAAANWKITYQ